MTEGYEMEQEDCSQTENNNTMNHEEDIASTSFDATETADMADTTEEAAAEEVEETGENLDVDYREEMRRLKAAYKAQKQEERRRQILDTQSSGNSGSHTGRTIVVSVVSTLLVLVVAFWVLLYCPSQNNSFFHYLVKKYASSVQNPYPKQDDVSVGGEDVSPGDNVTITVDGEISASAVYAKAAKSVVGIEVRQLSGSKWEVVTETVVSQGSGVVYSEDGQIMTNYHVIESAVNTKTGSLSSNYKVVVYFNTDLAEYYEATSLIGYDADNDIALLKVEAKGLHPVEFADADALIVGDPVIAIGSPGGLEFMNSVSEGIISGLDRDITSSSTGVTVYELIQTTAAINPGNSGGALLDREGRLIGICVIKIVSESYEGMGFAINSNTVTRIIDSFLEYGRYVKPVLGVEVDTRYDAEAADNKGWPAGAYVATVTEGGAAQEAGIKAEDIICEIGGERITQFSALRKILLRHSPEESVTVRVYRTSTDEYLDFTVVLDAS